MIKKIPFLLISLLLIAACCGSRGPRIKAGFSPRINLVEIIYKGLDDKILFAGPIKFKQVQGSDLIDLDITTEFIDGKSDSVLFKFTLCSKEKNTKFTHLSFIDRDTLFSNTNIQLMYEEQHRNIYRYRYSFSTTFNNFETFLRSKSPYLIFDITHKFKATKRWIRDAREINKKISLITSGYL